MKTGNDLPILSAQEDMKKVLYVLSEKQMGIAILLDDTQILGVITDGDIRRNSQDLWERNPLDIATKTPHSVDPDLFIEDAVKRMSETAITQLLVTKNDKLVGVLHLHDCMNLS